MLSCPEPLPRKARPTAEHTAIRRDESELSLEHAMGIKVTVDNSRNGIGRALPGDKTYACVDNSQQFFWRESINPQFQRFEKSLPPLSEPSARELHETAEKNAQNLANQQQIDVVRSLEEWAPGLDPSEVEEEGVDAEEEKAK